MTPRGIKYCNSPACPSVCRENVVKCAAFVDAKKETPCDAIMLMGMPIRTLGHAALVDAVVSSMIMGLPQRCWMKKTKNKNTLILELNSGTVM